LLKPGLVYIVKNRVHFFFFCALILGYNQVSIILHLQHKSTCDINCLMYNNKCIKHDNLLNYVKIILYVIPLDINILYYKRTKKKNNYIICENIVLLC